MQNVQENSDVKEDRESFFTPRLRFRRLPPRYRAWVDVATGDSRADQRIVAATVATIRGAEAVLGFRAAMPADVSQKDQGGVEVSSLIDFVAESFPAAPRCLLVPAALLPKSSAEHRGYAARTLGFTERFLVGKPNAAADPRVFPYGGNVAHATAAIAEFVATLASLDDTPSSP